MTCADDVLERNLERHVKIWLLCQVTGLAWQVEIVFHCSYSDSYLRSVSSTCNGEKGEAVLLMLERECPQC